MIDMTNKSGFLKTAALALALLAPAAAPIAAHASALSNDPSFISEVNAAYGTHFTADTQAPAAQK